MSRYIDFGYDGNKAFLCIFYDVFYFFLCVESLVGFVIEFARMPVYNGFFPFRSYFSEFWIFFYFDAPP